MTAVKITHTIPIEAAKRLPQMWMVPHKNTNFIGRNGVLAEIENYFSKNNSSLIITACHGLGGTGKTQLALEYVWQHYNNFNGVVWFNAENRTRLKNCYIRLGRELHIISDDENKDDEELTLRVKHWLEDDAHSGWLLVYDNAMDYESIRELLPVKGGRSLVTSRYAVGWPQGSISVNVFNIEESRSYICKILDRLVSESVKTHLDELAETLGRLPLALGQACAFIKNNKISISHYLELYKERKQELLCEKKSLLSDELLTNTVEEQQFTSVYITWKITMNTIRRESLLAADLLNICACLANKDIPVFLLKEFVNNTKNKNPPEFFEKALGILNNYSMIEISKDTELNENVTIHLLVQEVIRLMWKPSEMKTNFVALSFLFNGSVPYGCDKPEDLTKMRVLLPHLEIFLRHLEDFQEKKLVKHRKFFQVFWRLRKNKKKDHLNEIIILLGHWYYTLGFARNAQVLWERALLIKETHYGPDHPSVATTLSNLGNAYHNLGNYQKACEVLERALRINETHYGPGHPSVATTLSNIETVYSNLGNYQKACEVLERALPIMETHYGPDHPSVATILSNLGNAYGDLGNYQQACEVLERALRINETHYGPDHPSVATTLSNIGIVYGDLGNYPKACEVLERALRINETHYGPDHPSVATTLSNIGIVYGDLGNYPKACEVLERALPIMETHYGPDHPSVATTLSNLGSAYGDLGNYQQACEVLERALRINETHYGPDHPSVATTLSNIGIVYSNLGNYQKACEVWNEPCL